MIHCALRLATTLGDVSKAARLESVEAEIEGCIKDMQLNKNFLENRLDEQLRAIRKQRVELDTMEDEAIRAMLKEDNENTVLIGSLLECSAKQAFGIDNEGGIKSCDKDHKSCVGNDERGKLGLVEAGQGLFVSLEADAEDTDDDMDSSSASIARMR